MIHWPHSLTRTPTLILLACLMVSCGGSDSTGPGNGNGEPTVTTVDVQPSTVTLGVGETRQLTATARSATGPVTVSISWSSQRETVATVSGSGSVTAVGPGTTLITASAGTVTGSASITVTGTAPEAPSDLAAFATGPDAVNLTWTDNSVDEQGFEIERSLQQASGFTTLGTTGIDVTSYTDDAVDPETTYYYRVRATGSGDPSEFSNVDDATTTAPLNPSSPYECEREGYPCTWTGVDPTVFDEIDALGDEILTLFDGGMTVAEVVSWLQAREDVAYVLGGVDVVRFRIDGGRPAWIMHPDALLIPDVAPSPQPGSATGSFGPSGPLDFRPAHDVVGDDPKNKRALLMSPYDWQVGSWNPNPQIAALLSSTRDYKDGVVQLVNSDSQQQIGIDDFTGWDGYDAIHVLTHGNQVCEDDGCVTMVMAGRTEATAFLNIGDEGVDLVRIEYGDTNAGLTTDFFRRNYPEGLPDTIVYISACRTTRGEDLESVLAGNGGVYLGWTEIVWADTSQNAALAFFQTLITKGVPSTEGFLSLREGADDLTIDRPNRFGSFATLDIHQTGDDLRIREVAFPLNPLTKQALDEEEQAFPYPIVGQPGDEIADRIPYLIRVDGVDGQPEGFVVNVRANGFSAEPKSLTEGEMVDGDGNVWEVKGEVAVPFDAQQGQSIDFDVNIDLPEGGESRWDEEPTLGNPLLRFNSTITTEGGAEPLVRLESEVDAEFPLGFVPELERLAGIDELTYSAFTIDVTSECTPVPTTNDGLLRIVEADFSFDGQPGIPNEVVLFIPPTISESLQVFCPTGAVNYPMLIHYFAGFYSWHGGELCGAANEADEERGGLVMTGWTAGSDDVIAMKEYDRTCTINDGTFTEMTTIELVKPPDAMTGVPAQE